MTKQSSLTRKVKPVRSLALLFLIILSHACTDQKPEQAIELGLLAFNADNNQEVHKTSPLLKYETTNARDLFTRSYYDVNSNIKRDTIAVKLTNEIKTALLAYQNSPDQGLIFNYGLSEKSDSIQYILSLGRIKEIDGKPKTYEISSEPFIAKDSSAYYILLFDTKPLGRYKHIDETKFCRSINRYRDSIHMLKNGVDTRIKNIPDHPYLVYHEGMELYKFHDQNAEFVPTFLYIVNGMSETVNQNTLYQVPLLLWGDSSGPFPIDNNNYIGRSYHKKSADMGHLCPPNCVQGEAPIDGCK